MRWDNLFDDLEGQLEHELGAEEIDLQGEEERLRLGRLCLRDRLIAIQESSEQSGSVIQLALIDGSSFRVRPKSFGRDWMLAELAGEPSRPSQVVVALAAISTVTLDRDLVPESLSAAATAPVLSARLSLSFVLRDLCRRRASVGLQLTGGTLYGTIDRVGRDHCDLALHEPGSARRESQITQYRIVAFSQLLVVHT